MGRLHALLSAGVKREITRHTWQRILDPASSVSAIVAEGEGCGIVGIANYIVHENTSALHPVCLVQDLYIAPSKRAEGAGRQLLDWLVTRMQIENWTQVYWHTRETNYRARGLYDKFTPHSGFLRYVVRNTATGGD